MAPFKNLATTPLAFNRRALASGSNPALGPLAQLVTGNTWVGDTGFNLMVVPNPKQQFLVMISQLFETHSFEAVPAPVPNRSPMNGTAQNGAVKYSQIVAENVTKSILHEETGMWLNQTLGTLVSDPSGNGLQMVTGQPASSYITTNQVLRSGTIPHGNTIHATGPWSDNQFQTPFSGDVSPYIDTANFLPAGSPPGPLNFLPVYVDGSDPSDLQAEYKAQIQTSLDNIGQGALSVEDFINPIGFLNQYANNITDIVAMPVSTRNGGAVLNVPFENAFAGPQDFICTFLIETIEDTTFFAPTQDEQQFYLQLQYLQSIPLLLPSGFNGKPVLFPHWNVNTLIAI